MKKIYLSLALLVPGVACAEQTVVEQEQVKQVEVTEKDLSATLRQAQDERMVNEREEIDLSKDDLSAGALAKEEDTDVDRTLSDLDDDDFFGDSLDKMIEMGAVDQEIKIKPMPLWKVWILRIGSGILAKYDAFKKIMAKRYGDAKYIVAAAWAKARGKKLPKRVVKKKKRVNKKN